MSNPSSKASASKKENAGLRRAAREAAVQFLYQLDSPGTHPPLPDENFWRLRTGTRDPEDPNAPQPPPPLPPKAKSFTETLIQGVQAHRETLDGWISKFTRNYELGRIAAVDRNVLRVAAFELLHNPQTPPVVAINEAIEIAKKFGSEHSGRFVNGILDQIRAQARNRPTDSTPPPPTEPAAPLDPPSVS
jgi:N utilization substance protein B